MKSAFDFTKRVPQEQQLQSKLLITNDNVYQVTITAGDSRHGTSILVVVVALRSAPINSSLSLDCRGVSSS